MALYIYEEELSERICSFETDMGTYQNSLLNIVKDMMPTPYTGKVVVPDIYKSEGGVWELKKTVDMFSGGILNIEPLGGNGCRLACHVHVLCTIAPKSIGGVTLAQSDTVEEMAQYIRKYWCIPLQQNYENIPDTLEKLNTWLKNYGGSDIKVSLDNQTFCYKYSIDSYYPSYQTERVYKAFAIHVKDIKHMAIWLTEQRYQLVRVWSAEEERDYMYEISKDSLIEDEWISEKRGAFRFITEKPVCRVLKQYSDGSYVLQDISYKTKRVNESKIKDAIKKGNMEVIDLQISEKDKIIKKTVDLQSVCRSYGCSADEKEPLSVEEQKEILFYGLAYINSNITSEDKEKICDEIKGKVSIDADDLISMFTENDKWDVERYRNLDTVCADKVMYLIYEMAK